MSDSTENIRRVMCETINSDPLTRKELEALFGKENVFNTSEATKIFGFKGFLSPFVSVKNKKTGIEGTLTFQHHPRFYFDFQEN